MDGDFYLRHGAMSDPGGHGPAIDGLPGDAGALCAVVQGLLVHDYFGGMLYGEPAADFAGHSRTTLPVRERLDGVLRRDGAPLAQARTACMRSVGTCRDFALMLCAMLRQKGTPARVRCGFARYFGGGFEDHWVCEYRPAGEARWALADAQLDGAHRAHLGIAFDPADMPREQFLCAWQAWRAIRDGGLAPERFGHGEAAGLWFVEVNLARDLLALAKQETSGWDTWRQSADKHLDPTRTTQAEAMAQAAAACAGLQGPDLEGGRLPPPPPWSGRP